MTKLMKKMSAVLLTGVFMAVTAGCGQTAQNGQNGTQSSTQAENVTAYAADTESQNSQTAAQKMDVKVAAMKGPTAIGMVQMMKNAADRTAKNNYEFTITGTADEFTANLIKGDIQIAAVPANLAANLYHKSNGKIQVMGINTLGVLYILENGDTIQKVADLKGKTIYATGKGTTPEYTLRYLLKSAGINPDQDVTIEFKSEATEVAALMAATDKDVIAMLPQPYVTTVMTQNDKVKIALDVTEEWNKLAGADSTVVTGVVAVNADFAQKNPEVIKQFMEEYQNSANYVNANVEAAAQLVEQFDIFKAAVAQKAIPYCNITFINGAEMKTKLNSYYQVLFDENPASIGGAMPADAFYYMAK